MPLFDIIQWFSTNRSTSQKLPLGDLFEYRVGYPTAQVMLDRLAPVGEVVINALNDIKIHAFDMLDSEDAVIAVSKYVTQDMLDNYIYETDNLGGLDETVYERIGFKDNHSLVALFDEKVSIHSIRIGATSIKANQYRVEIKVNNTWIPLFNMMSSQETRDYFTYTFTTDATNVSGVRIRHKGDYYSSNNTGNSLAVAAYDQLNAVQSIKLSHFIDFSDAKTVADTLHSSDSSLVVDSDGWIDIEDGISYFDWQLMDNTRIWNLQSGAAPESLKKVIKLNNNLVAFGNSGAYTLSYTNGTYGSLTPADFNFGSTITAVVTDGKTVYVGTSGGRFYTSTDGASYSQAYSLPLNEPISSFAIFQSKLYIGTNRTQADNLARLYSWDGQLITLVATMSAPIISAMAVAQNKLYIGTNIGYIYHYLGVGAPELSFDAQGHAVNTLTYSPVNGKLWAGVSGGSIYTASFTSSTAIWSGSPFFANDSATFTDIVSDQTYNVPNTINDPPINHFVWICSGTELVAYTNTSTKYTDANGGIAVKYDISFDPITFPVSTNIYKTIASLAYFNNDLFGVANDGKIYKLNLGIVGTKERTVYAIFRDAAGNTTSAPNSLNYDYVFDNIWQDKERDISGNTKPDGRIYQVTVDNNKEIIANYSPNAGSDSIVGIDRNIRSYGHYISYPFYIAELTAWDKLTVLYNLPAAVIADESGLDFGGSIDVYVRSASTKDALLIADWGNPLPISNLNGAAPGTNELNIGSRQGKWMQFYAVLTTASKNISPELLSVDVSYRASGASYFFTSMFDTVNQLSGYYNHVVNADFKTGITNWTANIPGDMGFTWGQNDRGIISVYGAGNGVVSTNAVVDNHFFDKDFLISFDYITSQTYSTGAITVYLVNRTTDSAPITLGSLVAGDATFTQTAHLNMGSESTHSYQLVFARTNAADAGAYSVDIDNVYIGPDYSVKASTLINDPPKIRRGILTANTSVVGGNVEFAYTTEDTFNYNSGSYTRIVPNRVFTLAEPSSNIRFGVLFISTGADPVVVHDFGVILEMHETDTNFMDYPET